MTRVAHSKDLRVDDRSGLTWWQSAQAVGYDSAVEIMEERISAIRRGEAPETIWLLHHPPLLTAGTSAQDDELIDATRFPIFQSGRGGRYTYHGPGQRIAYVMLDLRQRFGGDLRAYVKMLERWIIAALARFSIAARTYPGRIGVWVDHPGARDNPEQASKIAAVGVRVRHGISYHGLAINVAPDLAHFAAIVPCGIRDAGVTSLEKLGVSATLADVDDALKASLADVLI